MVRRLGLRAFVSAAVLVIGAGLLFRYAGGRGLGDPASVAAEPQDAEARGAEITNLAVPQGRSGGTVDSRSPAQATPALSSFVRDAQGDPIHGAQVSWTPLRPEFLGVWVGWANQRWADIEAATLRSTSDASGRFELADMTADLVGMPSVLWVTHPRYLPALAFVEPVDGKPRLPQLIEMAPGQPISVLAVDSQGAQVSEADIEQTTPIPANALADGFDPQARRILRRTASTDTDGRADLSAWDGPLLLRAKKGDLVSEVWIGTPRPTIRLELSSTFEVGGGVILEAGSSIEGEQRVICQVQRGSQLQPLTIVPVADGAWGPVVLPLLDVDAYRFRIEGWNAEVREEVRQPPQAGSSVRVDFTLRAGLDVLTRVQDEEEQPIPNSTSTVAWDQDGVRVEARGHPVERGYTMIRGIPPGVIHVTAEAPGYVPANIGNWRIPDPEYIAYTIELMRGRRIAGRVLWRGEPVEDFEINYWPTDWLNQVIAPFRERADGSFLIEAATTGELFLCATAQGASPSDVMIIEPGDLPPPPVTLELGDLVHGKGQVVDAATGEPLPNALIQPFTSENLKPMSPWGAPLSVRHDGIFDCAGFSPGREIVRFSVPGYSTHWSETFGEPGETIDFGLISLSRRKDLVLQLVAGVDVDFTSFYCVGNGAELIPEQRFGSDGRVVFEGVSAGRYALTILQEGGLQIHERLVLLPEGDWHFTVPVAGSHQVRITVDPGIPLPDDAYVIVILPNPERTSTVVGLEVPPDRVVTASSLHAGEFRAELKSNTTPVLASLIGVIREEDALIEARLEGEGPIQRFRVVDSYGLPVPGIFLRMVLRDGHPSGWSADADRGGVCEMRQFAPGMYRAYMQHRELGYHLGIPVDVSRLSEEPIEIVFAPDRAVEVQLLDGLEPLPGVPCQLVEELGFSRLPVTSSDANGLVHWTKLGSGNFTVQIRQPGYWPTDAPVPALPPGERTELQVRRLGDLEVSVDRVSGGSTEGIELELESEEFAASVATWIADGRATSSTSSLALDAQGRLKLTGLPHGLYRWAIDGQEGIVEVHAGILDELSVSLP